MNTTFETLNSSNYVVRQNLRAVRCRTAEKVCPFTYINSIQLKEKPAAHNVKSNNVCYLIHLI